MGSDAKVVGGLGFVTVLILAGIFAFGGATGTAGPIEAVAVAEPQLVRDWSPQSGPRAARVTLVEFGDYQCPACAGFAPTLEMIRQEYADRVRVVYRHFPFSQHANAPAAARAGQAAERQGKFWEMTTLLYARQGSWQTSLDPTATFEGYVQELGLDLGRFRSERDSAELATQIGTDLGDGRALGVNSTPTILINGSRYAGNLRIEDLRTALDTALTE